MASETDFLTRVSARLGRRSPTEAAPPVWKPSLPLPGIGSSDPDALADRFALELERIGGKIYRTDSPAEVGSLVASILTSQGLQGSVVRWSDPTLEGLNIDDALHQAGFTVLPFTPGCEGRPLVEAAEQAVAGVTGCDAAIAETGSLVLGSHRLDDAGAHGRGRVVSLLPPIHIAVVRREQLIYSALTLFRRLAGTGLPPQVIFASGPSRSADIENDLSIGVHGPGQVHVIIL